MIMRSIKTHSLRIYSPLIEDYPLTFVYNLYADQFQERSSTQALFCSFKTFFILKEHVLTYVNSILYHVLVLAFKIFHTLDL